MQKPAYEKFTTKEWATALASLTPGGSEFLTPQECVEYVRKKTNYPSIIIRLKNHNSVLLAAVKTAAASCKSCQGTGLAERFTYDAAIGRSVPCGFEDCRTCKFLRDSITFVESTNPIAEEVAKRSPTPRSFIQNEQNS